MFLTNLYRRALAYDTFMVVFVILIIYMKIIYIYMKSCIYINNSIQNLKMYHGGRINYVTEDLMQWNILSWFIISINKPLNNVLEIF